MLRDIKSVATDHLLIATSIKSTLGAANLDKQSQTERSTNTFCINFLNRKQIKVTVVIFRKEQQYFDEFLKQ